MASFVSLKMVEFQCRAKVVSSRVRMCTVRLPVFELPTSADPGTQLAVSVITNAEPRLCLPVWRKS
jgi:hypothetical protein